MILVALQIPLIYMAGSDPAHTADQHPLDHVFDAENYQSILVKMKKDS